MDLTLQKRTLQTLLARVSPAVAKNATQPSLACVLLEAHDGKLTASASNTYTSIRSAAEAKVSAPGSTSVNAKVIGDIVKNLPEGEISLKLDKHALLVRSGKIRFKLPTLPAEDFPVLPVVDDGAPRIVLKAAALATLLRAVTYAASTDDTRPHLAGMNLEADPGKLTAACTDGHRLALSSVEPESGAFANAELIPTHAFAPLKALAGDKAKDALITLALGPSHLFVRTADVEVMSVRSNDKAPPYGKVVPPAGAAHRVTVRREDLLASIRRVGSVSDDRSSGIRMRLSDGQVALEAASTDRGEGSEELDVDYAGPGLTIGFNAAYMLEALDSFASDEVVVETNGELDPLKLTAASETTISICMPMRC